jgi:CheY-like chemotaxis protein
MDEGQISQVIQNIVKNAEQAMPEGGNITIRMENVSVSADDSVPLPVGRYVKISTGDQGVGIIPKHLAKVFDPYFSTKQEGSGLGLAASYSIIKNHDGLITVESTPAFGTTFHIYLPASGKKPAPKKETQETFQRSGEKILIMDDDPDVLTVAENMLCLMGYKTGTASDGTEAVQLFTKAKQEGQPFDGIILDLTIPGGMGGLETIKQLSRVDPEVKAVVSSGYANDPIMADFEEHGFSGVIAKPYTMEKLGGVLRQLFG